ncbi:MAG: hypothetical protein DWQ05_15855 [Calditrichaeota bacterium]|nr:MAG: hypothetical protein DWQ05_15855 [Calditrichota bacterium]
MKYYRNLVKNFVFLFLCILIVIPSALAQEKFDDWLKKEQQKLQDYKDERDREFGQFLQREWREMQLMRGIKVDKTPKPVTKPVADPVPEKLPAGKPKPPVKIIKDVPAPNIDPKPDLPDLPAEVRALKFHFFHTPVVFPHGEKFRAASSARYDKQGIAQFWQDMSKSDYEPYIENALQYKTRLGLNDWGYCVFLKKLAAGVFPRSESQQNLFIWFVLIKSGYDARVGYSSDIYVLLPTVNSVFSVPYFTIENKRYYVIPFDAIPARPMSLTTYDGTYRGATRAIDLHLDKLPKLNYVNSQRKLRFEYGSQAYSLTLHFNKNLVDFLHFYPQTDLDVYFSAQPPLSLHQALLNNLRPVVKDKSEKEAVNILLRFVQTAFDYKTDQAQFTREKYFFPIETLHYPFSDCEDRSILFAYLVRNLLKLDVVGLDYPGHIATAVNFSDPAEGAFVEFERKKYIICDPTYVNAPYGRTLPKLQNVKPKILKIRA